MLKKITLCTAAFIALAPLALAGRDYRSEDFRYAPTPLVVDVSHELELATRHVRRDAERRVPPYNPFAREALWSLHRLEQRARHFHRTVERHGVDSRHVDRDFRRLLDAYDEAAYHVAHIRSHHVREDFRRVSRLTHRLARGLDLASGHGRIRYEDDRAYRRGNHGSVDFGDDNGRTRYRVRVDW